MLLLKETMPCLVLVTTKMIFTNKKTSRKYHIFKQSKFFSIVLVRSTVRYSSVRFCIFYRGSVRFGGSVKFLVRSNTRLFIHFAFISNSKLQRSRNCQSTSRNCQLTNVCWCKQNIRSEAGNSNLLENC